MSSHIPVKLRRLVAERAGFRCEYCLIDQADTFYGCQIDHIISEKHGGKTDADNLAYACFVCNCNKGSDIASLVPATGSLCRLFNPRTDSWADHFKLEANEIIALSDIAQVTIRLLGFNQPERLAERAILISTGRYPPLPLPRRSRKSRRKPR